MKQIAALSVILFLAISCGKEEEMSAPLLFSAEDGLEEVLTKAAITSDNLGTNNVRVYAEKNATALTNMNPATISIPKGGAYWMPTTNNANTQWDNGKAYTFQGYAYTKTGITIPNTVKNGHEFTVTQPTSYEPSSMADYVFSKKVSISAEQSKTHPLINLEFDHVLPAIQVYVTCAEAMQDVSVSEMTLSGLYYTATMKYSIMDEQWTPTLLGERSASYTESTVLTVAQTKAETQAKMNIISVPQSFNESTRLTITYSINESMDSTPDFKEYTQSFALSKAVSGITSGHRTVFHVVIDNGIHLTAAIAPWKEVDFIEGTVLPPIPTEPTGAPVS